MLSLRGCLTLRSGTRQAQEWYREEAVGKAIKQATLSAETNALSVNGGHASRVGEAEEGLEAARPESGAAAATLFRENVFVTTKIHPRDYSTERIGAVVAASKANLQVRASLVVCGGKLSLIHI